eukprot:UN20150
MLWVRNEGKKLLDLINKNPKTHLDDSRKMVRELSKLIVRKKSKNTTIVDLIMMIEQLQTELTEIKELQKKMSEKQLIHGSLNERKWVHVGQLNDIEKLVTQYKPTEYDYGVRYNHTLGC